MSGTTRGAWIELKVGYGKTTPAQRSMLARLGGLCIRRHEYDLGEPSLSVDRYWVGEDGEPKTITVCTAPAREMTPLVNHLLDLAI
jgi:hypothetical protein